MIVWVEQVFVPGIGAKPDVVVTVVLVRDVDHDAFGVLARVENLQAVGVVDSCFRRPGRASRPRRSRGGGGFA